MNENKNGSKKENKGCLSRFIWIGVILIFFLDIIAEAVPVSLGILLTIAIPIAFVAFIVYADKKSKASKASDKPRNVQRPVAPPQRQYTQASYTPPQRQYYDSDCMQASTGHDHERRLEQLDAFYKNGLIDKEEYEMMKSRYERMGYGR